VRILGGYKKRQEVDFDLLVLNFVELLHEKSIALYIQQLNMLTMENGKENPIAKMLLQMLSIGAEMENNQRKIRQYEGIQLAKLKGCTRAV
jgi:DNA invertase Pin-like site-specific DNA recombinase